MAVALGLYIGHRLDDTEKYLKLIAENYRLISDTNDEAVYYVKLYPDLADELGNQEFEISEAELDEVVLTYIVDNNIKVGCPNFCSYMIYLGCSRDKSVPIEEKTLQHLFIWKQQLVTGEPISPQVVLEMRRDCCS